MTLHFRFEQNWFEGVMESFQKDRLRSFVAIRLLETRKMKKMKKDSNWKKKDSILLELEAQYLFSIDSDLLNHDVNLLSCKKLNSHWELDRPFFPLIGGFSRIFIQACEKAANVWKRCQRARAVQKNSIDDF